MKATDKQKKIIKWFAKNVEDLTSTNDLTSPTTSNEMWDEMSDMIEEGLIDKKDQERLYDAYAITRKAIKNISQ